MEQIYCMGSGSCMSRKEQTGEIARVKGLYQSETMTDAIRCRECLGNPCGIFWSRQSWMGGLKEHSPLIGQMFELAQNPVSAATHVCGRWHNSSMFRKHTHTPVPCRNRFLGVNIWNGLSQGGPAECSCPRITASQRSRRSCIFPISFISVNSSKRYMNLTPRRLSEADAERIKIPGFQWVQNIRSPVFSMIVGSVLF